MPNSSVKAVHGPATEDKSVTADRPALPPLRGIVAREPAQVRRPPSFDHPRLTGRL